MSASTVFNPWFVPESWGGVEINCCSYTLAGGMLCHLLVYIPGSQIPLKKTCPSQARNWVIVGGTNCCFWVFWPSCFHALRQGRGDHTGVALRSAIESFGVMSLGFPVSQIQRPHASVMLPSNQLGFGPFFDFARHSSCHLNRICLEG